MLKYSKGTIITCEQGHEICEFDEDIYSHSLVKSSNFTNFRGENKHPKPMDRIGDHPCYICGSNWVRIKPTSRSFCIDIHIKDKGWNEE